MQGYSRVTLVGNLGADPEMRFTQDGVEVTSFNVAVSFRVAEREETTWYRVNCWKGLAKLTNDYLHKGSAVLIEGRLKVSKWEAQDGSKHSTLEVVADRCLFLDRKPKEDVVGGEPEAEVEAQEEAPPTAIEDQALGEPPEQEVPDAPY